MVIKYWKTILTAKLPSLPHLDAEIFSKVWKKEPPTIKQVEEFADKVREENKGKEVQILLESVPIEISSAGDNLNGVGEIS